MTPKNMERPPDHDERMKVMRRVAEWHLGDSSWAGLLITAYLYPKYALDELEAEILS